MPILFIIVGIALLISGVRGTSAQFLTLAKGDLVGSNSFLYWIIAILIIGAVGYAQDFRTLSRAFLALVLIVLLLAEDKKSSGGFFTKFQEQVSSIGGTTASGS